MWPTKYIPFPTKPRISRRFILTTQPYPIELQDSMKSAHPQLFGSATFKGAENFASTASVLSGTLISQLKSHTQPPDSYTSGGSIVTGTLVSQLRSIVQPAESIDSEGSILEGTLVRILVTYPHWPLEVGDESHQSSGSILSGTLT